MNQTFNKKPFQKEMVFRFPNGKGGREGGREGAGAMGSVVRALASPQCGVGSIPRCGVICGLSLLVLYPAQRGFSAGTPVFPSLQKPIYFDMY